MKLTKLLPIVVFSGMAAIAAPLVGSCTNNGGNTPEPVDGIRLDTWTKDSKKCSATTGENYFAASIDQQYTFFVDWSGYTYTETWPILSFDVTPYEGNSGELPIDENSVYVKIGNAVLHKWAGDIEDKDAWMIDGDHINCITKNPIAKNDEIIIKAKFTTPGSNCVATVTLAEGL